MSQRDSIAVPGGARKLCLMGSVVLGAAGLITSLAYLFVNLMVIVESPLPAATFPAPLDSVVTVLKVASIDLSAVTPLVLTLFFGEAVWNCVRLTRRRLSGSELRERVETLPFSRNHQTVWIQLGLIGTLWGFMLIGWGMRGLNSSQGGADSSAIMNLLLNSFGTALLSTFAGVVLAYIFAPGVIRLWRWMTDVGDVSDDISAAVDKLNQRLSAATRQIGTLEAAISRLTTALDAVTKKLSVDFIDELIETVDRLEEQVQKSGEAIATRLSGIDQSITKEGRVARELLQAEAGRTREASATSAKAIADRVDELRTASATSANEVCGRLKEIRTAVEKSKDALGEQLGRVTKDAIDAGTDKIRKVLTDELGILRTEIARGIATVSVEIRKRDRDDRSHGPPVPQPSNPAVSPAEEALRQPSARQVTTWLDRLSGVFRRDR